MGKAVLPVQLDLLRSLFMLPESFRILSVAQDAQYESANFLLESPEISDRPNGAPLPHMILHVTVEQHPDNPDFRKVTVRSVFEEP